MRLYLCLRGSLSGFVSEFIWVEGDSEFVGLGDSGLIGLRVALGACESTSVDVSLEFRGSV